MTNSLKFWQNITTANVKEKFLIFSFRSIIPRLVHSNCIVIGHKFVALSFAFAILQLSIKVSRFHDRVTLTFPRRSSSLYCSTLCNERTQDKMFNTRSSNNNSTSEFQFLLSYIARPRRRRRNGRKKCTERSLRGKRNAMEQYHRWFYCRERVREPEDRAACS